MHVALFPGSRAWVEAKVHDDIIFIAHDKLHHHLLSGCAILHTACLNQHALLQQFFFSDADWAKEKQKLYDAIGYQEDGPGTVYPKEVHLTSFSGSFYKDSPCCIACV